MAILNKGQTFSDGEQVTSAKLNTAVDGATFASGAVDDVSTQLSGGAIIVKDGGVTTSKIADDAVTPAKLSLGSPNWDANGNLGIGTNSPSEELHVAQSGGSSDPSILLENTLAGSSNDTIIRNRVAGSGTSNVGRNFIYFGDAADDNAGQIAYYHDGDSMRFLTSTSEGNPTEKMRITSTGGLLIGRTLSSSSSEDNGIVLRSDGEIYLAKDGTGSQNHILFINNTESNAVTVGSVSTSGSSTAYNTSSDYRLKEDVIEIEGSLGRLKALKPCNFRWISDGTRVDGFLAHEAQEVVPEAVTGTKDAVDNKGNPDYQGIDQSKLVPLLTKALQEAVAKIEALEARVLALES